MGNAVTGRQGRSAPLLLALLLLALAATFAAGNAGAGAGSVPAPDLAAYPWFYLRDGQPLGPDERPVELIAVGDVMPGRGVASVRSPLASVAPWLQAADLALGNLEAALVAGEPAPAEGQENYFLVAPPAAATMLAGAGFDLLGLANNHTLDAGVAGLSETAGHLLDAGITPLGAGPAGSAYEPTFRELNGVRLAFLAFTAVANPDREHPARTSPDTWTPAFWDEPLALAAVQSARARADAVVVSLHWGYEYETRPDPAQLRIANSLIAAGADLLLGHHPHAVQPVAVGEGPAGSVTAYSLGNFLFDQEQDETRQGLALRAFFDQAGLRAVQALPVAAGLHPRLLPVGEAEALLSRIVPAPRAHYFACSRDGCQETAAPDEPSAPAGSASGGPFWSGAIDLTGDGRPELIGRAAGQVTVYDGGAAGEAVWQSPPEWRVIDVALGDPNDDGRGELFLALRREDDAGHWRSQPYVVGYRGGAYQLLWGGRAVIAPILEVELGDVDGDGAQELVVLEEQEAGATLALWRWQGWTFSLVWRSAPGPYTNLTLLPAGDRLLLAVEETMAVPEG